MWVDYTCYRHHPECGRRRRKRRSEDQGLHLGLCYGGVETVEKASSVAAVYDVHGNLPALEAMLSDLERVNHDLLVVGGDVASGPMAADVLDRLEGMGDRLRWVRGNADREVVASYDRGTSASDVHSYDPALRASVWSASRIGRRQRDLMASFQERVEIEVEGLGGI